MARSGWRTTLAAAVLMVCAPAFAQTVVNNWATWTVPTSYPNSTVGGGSGSRYAIGTTGSVLDPITNTTIGLTLSGEINSTSTATGPWNSMYPAGTTVDGVYKSAHISTAPTGVMLTQTGYTTDAYKAHTVTFSTTASDVVMALWSLGSGSSTSTLTFSQPFQILSSNGRLNAAGDATNGYTLSAMEGNGVIQFLGSYSSLSWNVSAPEYYGGFNLGMTSNPVTGYGSVTPYNFPSGVLPPTYDPAPATPDIVSANNRSGTTGFNLLSNVGGTSFNNRFDGGTLQVDSNNAITNATFTITSNKGYIDQNGKIGDFRGVISNDGASAGRLYILNSAGAAGSRAGRVILSAVNTHTGGTEVGAGATLQISNGNALGGGRLDLVGTATETATLAVTASTTITNNISVAGDPTFDIASGTTTTVSGVISDGSSPGDVVKTGAGTLVLTGANTYTGPTTVSQGTFTVSGSLSDRTAVTVASGATYNVNASDVIGSLAGAGSVSSSNTGAKVLTAGGDNSSTTFSGVIADGSGTLGLTKSGTGVMTLSGVNTYTGPTTVSAGTLKLSGAGSIAGSTAVTNNATLDVTQASGNMALGGTYAQGADGTLKMTLAAVSNQQVNVAGTASLNGTLDVAAAAGTYRAGRYTLITSAGLSGSTFSAPLVTNLASVTTHSYTLAYDANNVYLDLRSSAADTMSSMRALGADIGRAYNAQYGLAQLGLSYDCKLFSENNLCLSTGVRSVYTRDDGSTYDGVALIAAYRAQPDTRVGAWIDQNESRQIGNNVKMGSSTPMVGAFAAWNQNPQSGDGLEVKLSAAYGRKDLTLSRPVVGTSEAGRGSSSLSTWVAEATVSYGMQLTERARLAPFAGLRYGKVSNGGYTESSDVFSPLTFAKTSQSAQSVLAGVSLSDKPEGPIGLDLSAGVEHYLKVNSAKLSGSGINGLEAVQITPALSKDRPFASASLRFDVAKNQQVLVGLSHSKLFTSAGWVTSGSVRYVVGL